MRPLPFLAALALTALASVAQAQVPGAPAPLPVDGPPPPPPPPPPPVVPVRAPTPQEFVKAFVPVPGTHEVVLDHPFTHRPVKVVFTLPHGRPRKVKATRNKIEFVYRIRRVVVVRFLRNGTVRVRGL